MTITSSSFANVNVGAIPNDGTGDPLRVSFVKLNENFQYINEKIWPNLLIDPPSLTADIVSSYISQFNLVQASQVLVTQNEGIITANNIQANTITTNTFITDANVSSNVLLANSINGPIGTIEPNAAYFTNIWVNTRATVSNLTVNNQINANTIISNYLGSSSETFAYLKELFSSNIYTSNTMAIGGNITGNTFTVVSNIGFYQYKTGINLRANLTGTITMDMAPLNSNVQISAVNFGAASQNVLTINYGSIVKGTQRTVIFQNNVSSLATRYIVLPNSFNNKGVANITIPSAANAVFQFTALESDSANVFCLITNS